MDFEDRGEWIEVKNAGGRPERYRLLDSAFLYQSCVPPLELRNHGKPLSQSRLFRQCWSSGRLQCTNLFISCRVMQACPSTSGPWHDNIQAEQWIATLASCMECYLWRASQGQPSRTESHHDHGDTDRGPLTKLYTCKTTDIVLRRGVSLPSPDAAA